MGTFQSCSWRQAAKVSLLGKALALTFDIHCHSGEEENAVTALSQSCTHAGMSQNWDHQTLEALKGRVPVHEQGGGNEAEREHEQKVLLTMVKNWGAGFAASSS